MNSTPRNPLEVENESTSYYGNDTSQLADQYPQIDTPQRVDAPETMNAPLRKVAPTRDEIIYETRFSPHAHWKRKFQQNNISTMNSLKSNNKMPPKMKNESLSMYHTQIKDLSMLASSSMRAGKHLMECSAYFCLGVVYDNLNDYPKAIEEYKKMANLCKKTSEPKLEALAYNCIGVDLQFLAACNQGEEYPYNGGFSCRDNVHLENSVKYHTKHLEISDDAGQFIAHTNIALTLGSLEKAPEAAQHHQEALRIAIRLQSTYGQSIAVGNLALLALRQNDLVTAKACMDQHLQLVQSLGDFSAECNAWSYLGLIANREKDYEQATRYYEQTKKIAEKLGEFSMAKQATCHIGITDGNNTIAQRMQEIIDQIKK